MEPFEKILKKIPFSVKYTFFKFVNLSLRSPSPQRVEKVRALCKIQLRALKHLQEHLKVGLTEQEAQKILQKYVKRFRLRLGCPILVAFGPNTAKVHAFPSKRPLDDKDIILIDFGLKYSLLGTIGNDITRTFFRGEPSVKQKDVYKIVKKAQLEAMKMVRAGQTCYSVDMASRKIITNHDHDIPHSVGHGIGRYIHAPPPINNNNWYRLKENDIISIEPGIYIPGEFGVRIEDNLLVTKNGYEILSDDET